MPYYVTMGTLPRNASMKDVSRNPPQRVGINGYQSLYEAKGTSEKDKAISAIKNRAKQLLARNEEYNGLYDSTLDREAKNAARIKRIAKTMVTRLKDGQRVIDTAAKGGSNG